MHKDCTKCGLLVVVREDWVELSVAGYAEQGWISPSEQDDLREMLPVSLARHQRSWGGYALDKDAWREGVDCG